MVKDVTEGSVVGGNPAKFIKTRVLTNIKFGGGSLETVLPSSYMEDLVA